MTTPLRSIQGFLIRRGYAVITLITGTHSFRSPVKQWTSDRDTNLAWDLRTNRHKDIPLMGILEP